VKMHPGVILLALAAVPGLAQESDEAARPETETVPPSTAVPGALAPAEPAAALGTAAPIATAAPADTAAPAGQRFAAAQPPVIDQLDLGTTSITGNQELPKVLYIVPWKRSDLGDVIGRPVNSLLDEVLAPVDRSVFERHLSYYETLHGERQEE